MEDGEERGTESKDGSREGDMKAGQEDGVQKEGIEVMCTHIASILKTVHNSLLSFTHSNMIWGCGTNLIT